MIISRIRPRMSFTVLFFFMLYVQDMVTALIFISIFKLLSFVYYTKSTLRTKNVCLVIKFVGALFRKFLEPLRQIFRD